MKHHVFSPRVAAAVAGLAVFLIGGTATGAIAATPTVPGAPTGLTAAPGNGTATLSWSAPGSDGGASIDTYVIEGGPSPSGSGIQESTGSDTATISGLTNGTAYSLSVHAQNDVGDGPSATVTVTPQGSGSASGAVPGAPTGLTTSYGDGFIALSWSAPASTGGSAITGYHVYLGFSSSFVGAREFTTSGPSFRLTDALNGSTYFIKVTALNAAGEGPATPVASVTPDPPVAPSPPTGLTAQARTGEVVLSWSPPPGGLKSGDGYQIYMGTSPGHEGATPYVRHLIESTTSYAIAPLQEGVRYYFQVVLLDGNNQLSARSAEVSAVPSAGTGGGNATGPSTGASTPAGNGGGGATAPPTGPALRDKESAQHDTSPAPPAVLIVALAGLALAATGGAIAIVLIQRRRRGRGNAQVPAPRRPYDDQPAGPSRRKEEMNGPRYR
jgi:large repetitive protein